MRRLLFVLASVIVVFTFSCDTTQPSFDDAVPGVFDLETNVTPEDGGTVEPSSGEYVSGTTLEIEAVPEPGFVFERWEGDLTGGLNPTFLSMNRNRSVTAFFAEAEIPLTIEIVGQGSVSKEILSQSFKDVQAVEPGGDDLPTSRDGANDNQVQSEDGDLNSNILGRGQQRPSLSDDTDSGNDSDPLLQQSSVVSESSASEIATATVILTAVPDDGWRFDRWEGDLIGSENPDSLVVDEEKIVTAVFEEIETQEFTLQLNVEGQGFIEAVPDRVLFNEGEEVKLTAVPEEGWTFSEWIGDLDGSEKTETLIMDANKEVTSVFSMIGAPVIEILEQPASAIAGDEISPAPAVRIINDQDEPVEGIGVSVSLNRNEFASSSNTEVSTNSEGIARFDNLNIESASAEYRIIFEADDPDISNVNSSEFNVSPAEADPSATVADVPGGVAGGRTNIVISVFDRFNNPISNAENSLSVSISGANSDSPTVSAGEETGQYLAVYTPENAGTDEIAIELNGSPIVGSPFTSEVITSDISSNESSISADPTELQAGSSSTVTVLLRDASGNAIIGLSGSDFDISVSGNGSAGSVSEVSSGTYQFSVSNTIVQQVSVTVTAGGVRLSDTPEITFTPSDPEIIAIPSGNQPGTSIAGEVISNSPTVRITDEFGNNIPGVDVTVSEQNGQEFLSGTGTVSTNNSGLAVFDDLVITIAGRYNLVYTSGSLTITSNAFDVKPAAADASETTADVPNGSAGDRTEITITVRDEFGNRLEGVADNLAVSLSGDNSGADLETITDEGNGVYTTGYTPTVTGTDQITIEIGGTEIAGSPFESNVITSDADAVGIEQQPQQTIAGEPVAGPPSVLVTDDLDNPVEGVEVIVSVQGSASFDGGTTSQNTGSNGIATFDDLVIETAGNYTLSFNAIGASENAVSESFSVVAADPDILTRQSGNNQNGVVTESLDDPFVVRVTDQFGNTVSDLEVEFSIGDTPSGASGQALSNSSSTTNSEGEASVTLTLGNLTGTYTVIAAAGAAGSISFSASAAAGVADSFEFDAISSPQTAGQSFEISLTAFDAQGNIATGYQGTASLDASSGSVSPGNAEFTNGTASLDVTLDTASDNLTISASDGTISGTSNTFTVQSGGVSATNSNVSADPSTLQAGNSSTLTIELRDGSNNPASGLSGDLLIDVSGDGSSGNVSETGNGNYTAVIANTSAETVTVSVSVNGVTLDDEPTIEFTAADPDELNIVSGNNQSAAVSQQLSDDFVVVVTDEFDNPVPNTTVNFSIDNTPSGATGQELSSSSAQTNASGQASTRLTLGDTPGSYTVNASVTGVGSVTFSAEAQIGAASNMEITTQPVTTTAGQAISPAPQVRVTDNVGNPVENVSVSVSEADGETFDSGTTTQSTNSSGFATFSNLIFETSGSYRLVFNAAASGVSDVTSETFEVEPAAGDPSNSSADVPNGAAGDVTTITITVLDEFSNPVTGAAGDLAVSVSGANTANPSVSELGSGEYEAVYTPTSSGDDEIAITLDGTPIFGSPYTSTVSTSDISGSESTVSASPIELQAGSSSELTVELRDATGNVISGLSNNNFNISVSGNGSAGSVSESSAGTYRFSVTNTTAEQVTVTVTADGITLDDEPQITFTADAPNELSITTQPGSTVAGQPITGPPAVRATDQFGNRVPGVEVTVTEQGDQSFASGDEVVETGSDGVATFDNLVITRTGRYNLVFTAEGSITVTSNAFNVNPSGASSTETSATVPNGSAGDETNISITVRDEFGNRVEGVAGELSAEVSGANSGASFQSVSDEGDGIYETSYTPTLIGTDQVSIELAGEPISGSPYASEVITSDADQVDITQNPMQTVAGEFIGGPPAVVVTDDLGNPVGDIEVVVSLQGSPSFSSGTTTENTGSDGIAEFSDLVIETAGSYTMVFNAIGVSENAISESFEIVAADASQISRESGNNQSGTVTEVLNDPFIVQVTDPFGNPVEGHTVEFSLDQEPDGASGQLSASTTNTNSDGFAESTLTLGDIAGTYTVNVDGGNAGSTTFTATAVAGSAAVFTFDSISSPQTAGSPFGISIVAQDDQGNRATSFGETAALSTTAGTITPSTASFSNGAVSVDVEVSSAGANQTITASADQVTGTSGSFDVQTGGVDAANSSASADPEQLQAGETSQLTIELRDGSNNPVEGLTNDDFSIDVTGAATDGAVSATGPAGTYSANIDNETVETVTVTITANGATLNDTPSIEFTPADADEIVEISGGNQSGIVLQQLSDDFVVRVVDRFDNPFPGAAVEFSINAPTGAAGQELSAPSVDTGSDGTAASRLTLGDTPGTYVVTAEVSGVGTVTFSAEAAIGPASVMTIVTQPENTRAGQPISPSPQVEITDDAGNPVEGVSVTVSEDGGYTFDSGTLLRSTNSSGIATFDDLVIQSSGRYALVFNASESGVPNVTSASFNVNPGSSSAESSTLEVPDGTAGEETEIKLRVEDEFGNAVDDAENDLSVSVSGANTESPEVTFTGEEGEYAAFYTPLNSGDDVVEATVGGAKLSNSPQISTVSTSDVSATESIVQAVPDLLQVGNESRVTIELKDAAGNAIADVGSSEFSIGISGEGTADPVNETDVSGIYEFNVNNERAQTVTVTATVSGVILDDKPEIEFTPGAANSMAINTQPGGAVAGEPISGPPSVILEDEFNNRVPGVDVTVREQNGQSFESGIVTVETNASGVAEFSDLVITDAGQYNLIFSADGVTPLTSNAFTVSSADGDAESTIANVPGGSAGAQTNITITVEDEFGNPVAGVADDLSVAVMSGPNADSDADAIVDEGDGIYTTGYTPTATGDDTITITLDGAGIQGSPFTSTVITSTAESVAVSTQPEQTIAGQPVVGPPAARVVDNLNNAVPGIDVVASLQSGSFASGQTTVQTAGDGISEFGNLVINVAGSYTMEFNAQGVADPAATNSFEVVAAAADELAIDSGNNQTGTVTEALASSFVVQVTDVFGNAVENEEVTFEITDTPGGASGQSLSGGTVQTDGDGFAFATLTLGTISGSYGVTATSGGLTPVVFTATASAGQAASFVFDEIASPQTAGQPFTISLTAEDSEGNTADGYAGTATLSSTTGSVDPSSINFTDGTATADVTLSQAGSDITLTAEDGGVTGTSNAIEVQSGDVDAANSSASIDPVTLQAGQSSTLTIELRDGSNNPVSGLGTDEIDILQTSSASFGPITEPSEGTYTTDITNQTAETVTVTITASGTTLNDTPAIEFTVADADAVVEVSGNNQTGTVLQSLSEDFVVRVEDQFGNPVPNNTVSFTIVQAPDGANEQSLSQVSLQTNISGEASSRLTLGDTPGTYITDAVVDGVGTVSFSAEAEIGEPTQMSVTTQPSETTAGAAIDPAPAVTITDNAGNVIEGVNVTVSEQGGSGFDGGTLTQSTNASGIAEFPGLIFNSADNYTLVFNAAAGAVSNVNSDSFEVVPAEGSPVNTTADVPNGASEEVTTITITVRDSFGNRVTGAAGVLSAAVTDGPNIGASFDPDPASDNGNGTYTTAYTPGTVGTDQITIELGGAGIAGSPFESSVSTSEVSSTNSTVTADPAELQAGKSSQVTVEVRDAGNNPIPDLASSDFNISVSGDGSAGSVSETAEGGTYVFNVSNNTAEEVTVRVTVTGTTLDDQPGITFTAADPDLMLITTEPDVSEAGQPIAGPPAVRITDTFNNPVPQTQVSVSEQGNQPFSAGSSTEVNTNDSGFAIFDNLSIEETGQYNLVFSTAGVVNRTSNVFDVNASDPDPAQSAASVPNGSAGDSTPISITLNDTFGNRVSGASGTISVEVSGANSGATVSSIDDDGNGNYSTSYTPTFTGDDQITIQVLSTEIPGSPFSSEVIASEPGSVEMQQQPLQTVAGSAVQGPPSVVVTDEFGNLLEGLEVNVSLIGGSFEEGSSTSLTTGSDGVVEFSNLFIEAADSYTLDFNAVGVSENVVSNPFNVVADESSSVVLASGNNQTGIVTELLENSLTVRVTDQFGNPVENETVEFEITGEPGDATGQALSSATAQTDGDGLASTELTLGNRTGVYEVTGTLAGIGTVVFSASAVAGEAAEFQFDEITSPQSVDSPFTITITALDSEGNTASGYEGSAELSSTAGDITPLTTGNFSSGTVSIEVELSQPATDATITAADGEIAGTSNTFDVEADGAADQIEISSGNNQTGAVTEQLENPLVVVVTDQFGNPVENETIGFEISSEPADATGQTLSSATVQTDDGGLASTELTLGNRTGVYEVTGTLAGIGTVVFSASAVAGEAAEFQFDEITSPQSVDSPFTITITALDSEGNTASGYQGTADLSTTAGDITPTVAEFSNGTVSLEVEVSSDIAGATITATDVDITGTSNTFDVEESDPPQMSITEQPTETVAGESITPSPAVQLLDGDSNPILGVDITATLSSNSFSGTVDITVPTDGSGNAVFDDLAIETAAEGYTITFDADLEGAADVTSNSFDVTSATATAIEEISGNGQAGEVNTQLQDPFVVRVVDNFGNPVLGEDVTFTITDFPADAAGQTLSTLTVTSEVDGLASTTLTLGDTAGTYTTEASFNSVIVTFTADATDEEATP